MTFKSLLVSVKLCQSLFDSLCTSLKVSLTSISLRQICQLLSTFVSLFQLLSASGSLYQPLLAFVNHSLPLPSCHLCQSLSPQSASVISSASDGLYQPLSPLSALVSSVNLCQPLSASVTLFSLCAQTFLSVGDNIFNNTFKIVFIFTNLL
jgi:hypothetical protein